MRIILAQSTEEAIKTVAETLLERLQDHPASVLGLATGKTMEPVYALMVDLARERNLELAQCRFFMLDEYLGLPKSHPSSFKAYIEKRFIHPLGIAPSQIFYPKVHEGDLEASALEYEKTIKESGGIDLQLLGIGGNGHIGFNEPGSTKSSRTRVVDLTSETLDANRGSFKDGQVPTRALSMGIATILESKSLLMLATGKSKADAIKYLMNHHDEVNCPATYLKNHPHFTLVLDPDAASKVNLKI